MTNIFDSIKDIFINDSLGDNKEPLHIGEVMDLWTYYGMLSESNRFVEVGLNTTSDGDLIKLLKVSFDNCHKQIIEIQELLRSEGVPLPETSESKPKSDSRDIPPGVKLSDDEIANGLAIKNISSIMICAGGISQAIRLDVGGMWLKFFMVRVKYGVTLKGVMRKRGWLKIPPNYNPKG